MVLKEAFPLESMSGGETKVVKRPKNGSFFSENITYLTEPCFSLPQWQPQMSSHLIRQRHKFSGNLLGLLSLICDQAMQMAKFESRLRFEAEVLHKAGEICIDNANSSLDNVWRFDDLP